MPKRGILNCNEDRDYLSKTIPKFVGFGYFKKLILCWKGYFVLKWDISLKDTLPKVTVCNLMPSIYYVLNKQKGMWWVSVVDLNIW